MRSWFEFGYDGFPKGAQRRRFYQQRDDPCDSEEERDNDDESGDRPVLHLPLPKYTSLSRSSSVSSCLTGEDAEWMQEDVASATALVSTTVCDTTPARYGASLVTLSAPATAGKRTKRHFVVEHGGVCVATQTVMNDFAVAEIVPPTSRQTNEPAQYVRTAFDPQLLDPFSWDALHPGLVADTTAPDEEQATHTNPRCRYGHCAIALPIPSSALFAAQMAKSTDESYRRAMWPPWAASTDHKREPPCVCRRTPPPPHPNPALPAPASHSPVADQVTLLSFVVGGSACVPSSSSWLRAAASSGETASVLGSPLRGGTPRTLLSTGPTLNHPLLVLTVLALSESPAVPSRCVCKCFPLGGSSPLYLPPRVFASLCPWPASSVDVALRRGVPLSAPTERCSSVPTVLSTIHRLAYLGGSPDGREPMPFFAVTQLELNTVTWSLHHSVMETYGTEPASRYGHSATTQSHHIYVFGGVGRGRRVLGDMFVLDTDTLVWREVFIPSHYDVPRRAFHSAVVLPTQQRQRRLYRQAEAAEARELDGPRTRGSSSPLSHAAEETESEGEAGTSTPPGECSLVLIGGEGCGGATVAATWGVDLRDHEWRRWNLRALRYEGTRASPSPIPTSPSSPLPRRPDGETWRVRLALTTLADREAERHAATARDSTQHTQRPRRCLSHRPASSDDASMTSTEGSAVDNISAHYVSAFFGSLGAAIAVVDESLTDEDYVMTHSYPHRASVMLWGGTRSPPVLLLSQLDVPDESVRMQCCVWLISCDAHCSRVTTTHAPLLQRLLPAPLSAELYPRHSTITRQRSSCKLQASRRSHQANEELEHPDEASPSSLLARHAVELGNQATLEDQLADWHRAALKRLRDH